MDRGSIKENWDQLQTGLEKESIEVLPSCEGSGLSNLIIQHLLVLHH